MAKDDRQSVAVVSNSVYCISKDSKSFAVLTGTGKAAEVKLWDVGTNKCEATFSCADEKVTSMAFYYAASKKRKSEDKSGPSFIICGCDAGYLLVLDVKSGEVLPSKYSLSSAPTCLYHCQVSGHFLVGTKKGEVKVVEAGLDGTLTEKDTIKTGSKSTVHSLLTWDSMLAVGQETVTVYNRDSKEIVKSFDGHSSGQIAYMAYNGSRLATSALQDSTIFVWDTESDRVDPIFSATLPHPAKQLGLSSNVISAIYSDKCVLIGGVEGEVKRKVVALKQKSEFGFDTEPLQAAYLDANDQILTIRGSLGMPVFERLSVFNAEGAMLSGVLEREAVIATNIVSTDDKKEKKSKKARTGAPEVISGASVPVRQAPDAQLQDKAVLDDGVVVNEEEGLTSVTNLLIQALQARNPQLIENALGLNDENMIIESLEKLPEPISIVLLEELVLRVSKKPARVVQLGPWIRCLHVIHGKYMSSLKTYQSVLRPLQDAIAIHTESEDLIPALARSLKDALAKRAIFDEEAGGELSVKKADNYVEYVDDSDSEDDEDESVPDIVNYGTSNDVNMQVDSDSEEDN